jgi:hypothetical protein
MAGLTPEQQRELQRLMAEHGAGLTEEIVVNAARSPESPLHSLIEWDVHKAAAKYRALWEKNE